MKRFSLKSLFGFGSVRVAPYAGQSYAFTMSGAPTVPPEGSLVASAAIRKLARLHLESPLLVRRPDGDPEDHPALDILANPNPWYDGDALWHAVIHSISVDGNAYLLKLRGPKKRIVGLAWLDHRRTAPASDNDTPLTHYLFRVGGTAHRLIREDVIHLRVGLDVMNPAKGWSPLRNAGDDLALESATLGYATALVGNMGVPSVAISPKAGDIAEPTPEQNRLLKLRWQEETTGASRGKVVVLPFPVDIKEMTLSPDKLDLGQLRNVPVERICAALDVDPMVLGLPSANKTYSNLQAALEALLRMTVIPDQISLDRQMTIQLLRAEYAETDRAFDRDRSQIWVMQDDYAALSTRVVAQHMAGLTTINEARAELGLPPVERGDVFAARGGAVSPASR